MKEMINENVVVVIDNISQMRKMKSYLSNNGLQIVSSTDRMAFPVYYYLCKVDFIHFVRQTAGLKWVDENNQKKSIFDEKYSEVVTYNSFIEKGGWIK